MQKIIRQFHRLALLPLFLIALILLSGHLTAQQSPETWMDLEKAPTISAGKVVDDGQYRDLFDSKNSVFGDLECKNRSIDFSPKNHPTSGMPIDGCWFDTSIGLLEKGGYAFRPSGWEVGGYVNNFNSQLFPTKNSEHFIEYGENSITIRRTDRFFDQNQVTPAETGWDFPVFLDWVYPTIGFKLEHADGTPWPVDDNMIYSQMWYSDNGKFLAIWHNDGYFVLIDFETLTIKTIDAETNGYASLAISDNGQYVAVNVYGVRGLRIINTEECNSASPIYVSTPATCPSRIFADEFIEAGADEAYGTLPVFYGNDLLGLYMLHDSDEYREYVLRAPNTRQGSYYLALGDSFTSGEGAFSYKSGTDDRNNMCHLSGMSYPYLLGYLRKFDSNQSIACSAAKINDLLTKAQYPNDPKNNSLGVWLPGKKPQLEQISMVSPDIVTVGILGNDAGLSAKAYKCVWVGDCFTSYEERLAVYNEINDQLQRLTSTYSRIRKEALNKKPDARVFAIGYPIIAKEGGDCSASVYLSRKDIEFANHFVLQLNATIRAAASRAGVVYVDVEGAFGEHRLCDQTPWAVNGLVKGDDIPVSVGGIGPVGNESLHPNQWGHLLLAETIYANTEGLSEKLPWPNTFTEATDPLVSPLLLGYTPSDGVIYKNFHDDSLISTALTKQDLQSFESTGQWFKPYSLVTAGIASEFTEVGKFSADGRGHVSGSFEIPDGLPVGLHTFHLRGIDAAHQDIDVYQSIFVGETENDWDGDGVSNIEDNCIDTAEESICFDRTSVGLDTADSPPTMKDLKDTMSQVRIGSTDDTSARVNAKSTPADSEERRLFESTYGKVINEQNTTAPRSITWVWITAFALVAALSLWLLRKALFTLLRNLLSY